MQDTPPDFNEEDLASLEEIICELLKANPPGFSEYDLLKILQDRQHNVFAHLQFTNQFSLFHLHFLLFHTLYKMRDSLFTGGEGLLEINPLKITLTSIEKSDSSNIAEHDPLRDFYLDLSNLFETSNEDVVRLVSEFWKYLKADERRESALAELGLKDPVDYQAVKQQYRKLAMLHHPDRGGDSNKLQLINAAMEILESCYQYGK